MNSAGVNNYYISNCIVINIKIQSKIYFKHWSLLFLILAHELL